MIYFTSDWHLDHANIIRFCNRPFHHVDEMNNAILKNFFDIVKKGDTVFFLGDLAFGDEVISPFFCRMDREEINICIIYGNHDKELRKYLCSNRYHISVKSVDDIISTDIEGQSVTLCHYPMLTFNKSHFGAWQLFGHHHNGNYHKVIPPQFMGKKMNIGVDMNEFKPVSWNQVVEYMKKQPDNWDLLSKEERNRRNS
jgi:calcineurin-like phosphoesterase family protein